jgi:hypothetical protein
MREKADLDGQIPNPKTSSGPFLQGPWPPGFGPKLRGLSDIIEGKMARMPGSTPSSFFGYFGRSFGEMRRTVCGEASWLMTRLASLLLALVMSNCSAVAFDDLSGSWLIDYEFGDGNVSGPLASGSVATISEANSTICGKSTLGDRSDGFLIGLAEGSSFDVAITFRRGPTIFVRLAGGFYGDEMMGSFSAYSSDGGFWMGNFSAVRTGAGEGDANYLQDADLVPKPTVFIDPEAIWSEQQGKENRDAFEIYYSRDTVLMCRNKPMIWQWWL